MRTPLQRALRQPGLSRINRRELLRRGFLAGGALALGGGLSACGGSRLGAAGAADQGLPATPSSGARPLGNIGPLLPPDANKVSLPAGFSSRILAVDGDEVLRSDGAGTGYVWHKDPDGGATFPTEDGGWIYVSNSEETPGGVGALRFDAAGEIVDAYRICDDTRNNCAGGPTPWGTWITCEEATGGYAIECDPYGVEAPVELPAMGRYNHEAVAIDPVGQAAYLTEDRGDGGFYMCVADAYPDFRSGTLFILNVTSGDPREGPAPVEWVEVPDPSGGTLELVDPTSPSRRLVEEFNPTRQQVDRYTPFAGGEGIWYFEGVVYFATKGDSSVWALDIEAQTVERIFDFRAEGVLPDPTFAVDNVTVTGAGDVIVAEDGSDTRLVVVTPDRRVVTLLKVEHEGSELAGPAFSPDGTRLYFSSQRGDGDGRGITFEITGPFQG